MYDRMRSHGYIRVSIVLDLSICKVDMQSYAIVCNRMQSYAIVFYSWFLFDFPHLFSAFILFRSHLFSYLLLFRSRAFFIETKTILVLKLFKFGSTVLSLA